MTKDNQNTCTWTFTPPKFWGNNSTFNTSCGHTFPIPDVDDFPFDDADPTDDDFRFCPWCGRPITKIIPIATE